MKASRNFWTAFTTTPTHGHDDLHDRRTFHLYHDAKDIFSAESRKKQTYRLVGKIPTIAAFSYRHTLGMPFIIRTMTLAIRELSQHALSHHRT